MNQALIDALNRMHKVDGSSIKTPTVREMPKFNYGYAPLPHSFGSTSTPVKDMGLWSGGDGKKKDPKSTGKNFLNNAINVIQGIDGAWTNQLFNWGDGKGSSISNFNPGSILANQARNWMDGDLKWNDLPGGSLFDQAKRTDWKDVPGAEQTKNFGQGQWDAWSDGKFSWKDVPGLGGLANAGEKAKRTEDILKQQGWEDKKGIGAHDIVSFIGDVALAPSTYATFGAGSAAKAGKAAGKNAAKEELAKAGVKAPVRGGLNKAKDTVYSSVFAKTMDDLMPNFRQQAPNISPNINPTLAKRLAERKATAAVKNIDDAAAAARARGQNSVLNVDVPFTNITSGMGHKANVPLIGKHIEVKDVKIGQIGAEAVINSARGLGLADNQIDTLLNKHYGVSKADDLTKQQLDHFNDVLSKVPPKAVLPNRSVTQSVKESFQKPTSNMFSKGDTLKFTSASGKTIEGTVTGKLGGTGGRGSRAYQVTDKKGTVHVVQDKVVTGVKLKNVKTKSSPVKADPAVHSLRAIEKVMNDNKFVQDMGGRSAAGSKVSKALSFGNARHLGSKDDFVNTMGDTLQNAQANMRGNRVAKDSAMKAASRATAGLSDAEMKSIAYVMENKFPGARNADEFFSNMGTSNRAQIEQAAQVLKSILGKVGNRELAAGGLEGTLKNYFPHLYRNTGLQGKDLEGFLNDPIVKKYMGKGSNNPFNRERQGFETLADWKNVENTLKDALAKAPNAVEKGKIEEKLKHLDALMEEDPIKAVTKRYETSIRKTAMKEMYNDLKKSGGIIPKGQGTREGFKELTSEEAGRLGLEAGTQVHKEVLKNIENMDKLFSAEGINKLMDNVDGASGLWKTVITTLVPSHHVNNIIGSLANNAMAGVNMLDYKKATGLLHRMRKGQLKPDDEKILQTALDKGIIGSTTMDDVSDELANLLAKDRGKVANWNKMVHESKPVEFMRKFSEVPDTHFRLALYIRGLKQTGKPSMAADLVRKHLFNYGELTKEDRFVRLAVPFWNWTKNNIPLQIQHLAREPRFALGFEKIYSMLEENAPTDKERAEFSEEPLQWLGDTFSDNIPTMDLAKAGEDPYKFGINSLTPFAKMPFELGANHNYFTESPIDWEKRMPEDDYDPEALLKYFSGQSGIIGKGINTITGQTPISDLFVGKPKWREPVEEE